MRILSSSTWAAVLATTILTGGIAQAAATEQGRLVGRVSDAATGEPVAGAVVRVMAERRTKPDLDRMPTATSDAAGNYEVAVPFGHAICTEVQPPAGYYSEGATAASLSISKDQPTARRDFILHRGARVKLTLEDLPAGARFLLAKGTEAGPFHYFAAVTDEPAVTLPLRTGQFTVLALGEGLHPLGRSAVTVPANFDFDRIARLTPSQDGKQLAARDSDGRELLIERGAARLSAGEFFLRPESMEKDKQAPLRVTGRVVGEEGEPLANAEVQLGYQHGDRGGSNVTLTFARCNAEGIFEIEEPRWYRPPDEVPPEPSHVFLIVMHPGRIGRVTERMPFPKDGKPIEVGDLQLAIARTARLQIVDAEGNPMQGAWVEPGEHYLKAFNFAKTDSDGRCELANVPSGSIRLSVRHGEWSYDSTILVENSGDQREIQVKLSDEQISNRPRPKPVSPPLGAPAPDFEVKCWIDGKERRLADFRGKVVVLDFWGTWCSSCLKGVPFLKRLANSYGDRDDVVFLTIHSAGGELEQIKALQEQLEWNMPTAIDAGEAGGNGVLERAYAIQLWPSAVVIDRYGKISHSSALEEWTEESFAGESNRVANALGLPPADPHASEEAQIERIGEILNYRLREFIDRALATDAASK